MASTAESTAGPGALRRLTTRARKSTETNRFAAVLVLLIVAFGYFSLTQDRFFTSGNLNNLLSNSAILFMVAIGMTFVMIAGAFDLSVGSTLALAGIFFGKAYVDMGLPGGVVILLTLLAGAIVGGLFNGVLIGWLGVSFLVVTLATLGLFRGVVNLWSGTDTTAVNSSLLEAVAFNKALGIPVAAWLMLVVFLIALYVLRSTYFGRDIYAVGGNPEAARLSGIHVGRTIIAVFAVSGLLAALAGIIQVARVGAASPLVGETVIFDATAAGLLGGTSFHGGIGGVGGTVIGVLFLATLQNGLAVSGVEVAWQQVATGVILIAVVTLDRVQRAGWPPMPFLRRRT